MSNFNNNLITKVKLFHNDQREDDYLDLKYSFMLYVLEQLESKEQDEIDVCSEDYQFSGVNVDGFFFDEDSNVYNLIISIFGENNDDESVLNDDAYMKEVNRICKLISLIQNKKYITLPEISLTREICDDISKNIKNAEIVVTIISNYIINPKIKKDSIDTIDGINVSFNTYDLNDLQEKFVQLNKESYILNLQEKFGSSIRAIKISSTIDFDVYMCSIKGSWLAQLYREDGQRLLEPNVRSYLKRTQKTNAGILETVKSYPDQFVSYNNGLSSIASNVEIITNSQIKEWCTINKIFDFQIVNGGQTTATLAECAKDKLNNELDEVVVPVKLTVIKNIINAPMLISNISVFSNTQTAIKKSDPPSNLKYYIDLKSLSNSISLINEKGKNYICYFERTSGEYDTELRRNNGTVSFQIKNPKDKKFNKIQLATAINCWQQLPHIVNLGREKNFSAFNNIVKNQMFELDEKYFKNAYATIILFRKIDKLCKKQKLSNKSCVVSYTLSYISYLSDKKIDLNKIFEQQNISSNLVDIINDVMPKIHKLIINPPSKCPEPRMWARKEELWDEVKKLNLKYDFEGLSDKIEFYPDNEPQLFIENDSNFYNDLVWKKILFWNEKKRILNNSQINMIKGVIKHISTNESLTKKQISYAKDIFMAAVKGGFDFKS